MRVLLTDGSGLTSRQVAGLLSASGHEVEVLSPDPLCLARFTRHVKRVRQVPPYGDDPLRWLAAALEIYREGAFDVMLPTQEQVAVLAAFPQTLHDACVNTAVPSFAALSAVQDKLSAWRTLSELAIPQPLSSQVTDGWTRFPAYVKQPIGTASGGVRRIEDPTGLRIAGGDDAVLVQAAVEGPLVMCQSVFDSGTLVAFHANLRVAEGANGGASHKRGIDLPAARKSLEHLGSALDWNGALSADMIVGPDGPLVIDVNPRLVEPVNAARSGTDLVGVLMSIATGGHPAPVPVRGFRPGVASHQLVLAVLGAAAHGTGRRGVVAQLWQALRNEGLYADSREELTPVSGDPLSAVPLLRAVVATLFRPSSGTDLASGSVANYALSPAGWEQIRRSAERPSGQRGSTG